MLEGRLIFLGVFQVGILEDHIQLQRAVAFAERFALQEMLEVAKLIAGHGIRQEHADGIWLTLTNCGSVTLFCVSVSSGFSGTSSTYSNSPFSGGAWASST